MGHGSVRRRGEKKPDVAIGSGKFGQMMALGEKEGMEEEIGDCRMENGTRIRSSENTSSH